MCEWIIDAGRQEFKKSLLFISCVDIEKKMNKQPKPENLKSRRVTLAFRMLPEMHEVLRQAAHASDLTMGRYLEKALRAQLKRDGIDFPA